MPIAGLTSEQWPWPGLEVKSLKMLIPLLVMIDDEKLWILFQERFEYLYLHIVHNLLNHFRDATP